jgi:hypothetical protein
VTEDPDCPHGSHRPRHGRCVKHATDDALDRLEPLLARLRAMPGLTERKRGTFYRKSRSLMHFHEDRQGLFVDVRLGDVFERLPVNTGRERDELVRRVRAQLGT